MIFNGVSHVFFKMCGFVRVKFNLYEEVSARKAGAKAADINLSVASGLMDT